MRKEVARFEAVCWQVIISREEGGWADIKKGDGGGVVMVKAIIISVRVMGSTSVDGYWFGWFYMIKEVC